MRTLALSCVALVLVACKPAHELSPLPIDYVCTNDGHVSFLVEDVTSADRAYGGYAIIVRTEAMRYDYTPRPGDVCTLVEGGL